MIGAAMTKQTPQALAAMRQLLPLMVELLKTAGYAATAADSANDCELGRSERD